MIDSATMTDEWVALARTVERLTAHEEIRQAMYAYARGVDRLDEALITNAYHEDAWDDHGNFKGDRATAVGSILGRGRTGASSASMHHIGNIFIDLHGDRADVETYFVAYQRREQDDGRAFTRMRPVVTSTASNDATASGGSRSAG